jgi:hypothetical protein
MKDWCMWEGKRVKPNATTCYWLFGKKPECAAYKQGTYEGQCVYLAEALTDV